MVEVYPTKMNPNSAYSTNRLIRVGYDLSRANLLVTESKSRAGIFVVDLIVLSNDSGREMIKYSKVINESHHPSNTGPKNQIPRVILQDPRAGQIIIARPIITHISPND